MGERREWLVDFQVGGGVGREPGNQPEGRPWSSHPPPSPKICFKTRRIAKAQGDEGHGRQGPRQEKEPTSQSSVTPRPFVKPPPNQPWDKEGFETK